jgi:hypothetical protein
MGNKPGQTTTQQSQSAPWGPAQPGLAMGINAANSAFQSGTGAQPYTASMVTPFSQPSMDAFNSMTNTANASQPALTNQFNTMAAQAAQGGLTPLQQEQIGRMQGIAGNETGLNAMQTKEADWLNPVASGSGLTNNPYLDEVIRRSSSDIAGAQNLMGSAAGRYGSGGHEAALQKSIADMAAPLRMQDYQMQQQRMDQAIRDYGTLGTTGFGQRTGAINNLFNAGQTQQGNVIANNAALQNAYQGALAPADTLRSVGQNYESLMANQINDQRRIFDEMQNQPWKQIGLLSAGLQGNIPSGAGTTVGTSTAPGGTRLGGGLGGALAGATAFPGSPWLGALAGGLGGMLV